jgi:hypothetical protein
MQQVTDHNIYLQLLIIFQKDKKWHLFLHLYRSWEALSCENLNEILGWRSKNVKCNVKLDKIQDSLWNWHKIVTVGTTKMFHDFDWWRTLEAAPGAVKNLLPILRMVNLVQMSQHFFLRHKGFGEISWCLYLPSLYKQVKSLKVGLSDHTPVINCLPLYKNIGLSLSCKGLPGINRQWGKIS